MTAMTLVGSIGGQSIATRIGFRWVATVGLVLTGVGCLLLTQVSAGGSYFGDIFFGLLVFGPGLGATYVAASVATLAGVAEQESGLAAGLNTAAFQIGGALGSAVATTVAVSQADGNSLAALTDGFQSAFAAAAGFAAIGAVAAILLLTRRRHPQRHRAEPGWGSRSASIERAACARAGARCRRRGHGLLPRPTFRGSVTP